MAQHAHEHPPHLAKKRTIIKDRVGCVRNTTYNLPPEGHCYGTKSGTNEEGAGDLMSSWVTANPSLEKQSAKMIVASNVLAIKHGCITASSMREYAIAHPNIRMKESLSADSGRVDANHEGPFGKKTVFSDDKMEDIVQGKYTDFTNDDADYPIITTIKKTGFMPAPRTTRAADMQVIARKKAEEQAKPSHFTMKRFQNVKGSFEKEREAKAQAKAEARALARKSYAAEDLGSSGDVDTSGEGGATGEGDEGPAED